MWGMWYNRDVECLGCEMLEMWDAWDIGFSRYWMRDVECLLEYLNLFNTLIYSC